MRLEPQYPYSQGPSHSSGDLNDLKFPSHEISSQQDPSLRPLAYERGRVNYDPRYYQNGHHPYHYGPPPSGGGPDFQTIVKLAIFGATISLFYLQTAPKLFKDQHNPEPPRSEQKSEKKQEGTPPGASTPPSASPPPARELSGKLVVKDSGRKDAQGASLYTAEYIVGGKTKKLGDFICGAPGTEGKDRLQPLNGSCNPPGMYAVADDIETTDRVYREGDVIGYEPDASVGTKRSGFALGFGTGSRGGLTCTKREDAEFLLKEAREKRFKFVEVKN